MKKQEAIKKAYGEHWETVKDYVDENGWCEWDYKNNCSPSRFEIMDFEHKMHESYNWRPKSLQGIENNNGWIKIESEDDLPKETGNYFFTSRSTGNVLIDYFTHDSKVANYFFMQRGLYSHYQPIQKPLKPLY